MHTVTGNTIVAKYGITLTKLTSANISSNAVVGNGTGQGAQLVNCNSIAMSGNTVRNNNVDVQVFQSPGRVDHLYISNNRFWDCTVPVDAVTVSGEKFTQHHQ